MAPEPVPVTGAVNSSSGALRSAPLRHAPLTVALPKKSVLNLRVDAMQPLLRAIRLFSITIEFCFQLREAIFGPSQLI